MAHASIHTETLPTAHAQHTILFRSVKRNWLHGRTKNHVRWFSQYQPVLSDYILKTLATRSTVGLIQYVRKFILADACKNKTQHLTHLSCLVNIGWEGKGCGLWSNVYRNAKSCLCVALAPLCTFEIFCTKTTHRTSLKQQTRTDATGRSFVVLHSNVSKVLHHGTNALNLVVKHRSNQKWSCS